MMNFFGVFLSTTMAFFLVLGAAEAAEITPRMEMEAMQLKIFEEGAARCMQKGGACTLIDSCDDSDVVPGDGLCPRTDVVCCQDNRPLTTSYCEDKPGAACLSVAECGSSPRDYRSVCPPEKLCCVE